MRIALTRALIRSMRPIVAAFGRLWQEAQLVNLADAIAVTCSAYEAEHAGVPL